MPPNERDILVAGVERPAFPEAVGESPLDANGYLKEAYAIVVGINAYRDARIRNLNFARSDAQAFREVLIDKEVGRFNPENVLLLVDEQATEREIRIAMVDVASRTCNERWARMHLLCRPRRSHPRPAPVRIGCSRVHRPDGKVSRPTRCRREEHSLQRDLDGGR